MKKANRIGSYLKELPLEDAIELHCWYLACTKPWGDNYFLNFYAVGSMMWANGVDYRPIKHKALLERTIIRALNCRMAAQDKEYKGDRKIAREYWDYWEKFAILHEQL